MIVKATFTNFQKVSGWTNGPKKPSTITYSDTAENVKDALTTALNAVTSMDAGETITIVINATNEL